MKKLFPDDEAMRLLSRPMRRHHYLYGRNRYLSNPKVLAWLAELHASWPLNRPGSWG